MAAGQASRTSAAPIVIDEQPSAADWDAYVRRSPEASGYHQFVWKGVLERAFGQEGLYLAARRDGAIAGVLPLVAFRSRLFGRFATSLPFVNYGGVLADAPAVADSLARRALALAKSRGWKHVELRHVEQQFPEWPARRHKVTMLRPLPGDAEALWSSIDRKVRNLVRKAEKSGCAAESGGGELVADFYRVFARNMRDLGTPVYSRRLFDEVLASLGDQARVHVVRFGREPIAASVTVRFRDRIEVPWASALRAHSDKAPNMLLYWSMLREGVAGGATTFDFGRSTPGEGTYHFKRQWGADPRPLVWEYLGETGALPDRSPGNPRFRAAIAVWQRLPVAVATFCGPRIVRHIP